MYVEYYSGVDLLALIGFFIMLIPVIAWLLIGRSHFSLLKESTVRVQVLATRTCLFLPTYAFCMWISLVAPILDAATEIPIAIMEAYSFYCFLAMVTEYLGGADATLELLMQYYHPLCCCQCCPCAKDAAQFTTNLLRALWYCLWVRPVCVLVQVIAHYKHIAALNLAMTVINLVLLVWAFLSLINHFHSLMEPCTKLWGAAKVVLLKMSIGLVVVQGMCKLTQCLLTTKF